MSNQLEPLNKQIININKKIKFIRFNAKRYLDWELISFIDEMCYLIQDLVEKYNGNKLKYQTNLKIFFAKKLNKIYKYRVKKYFKIRINKASRFY